MSFLSKFSSTMRMSSEDWVRHSNPLSVYTRMPCLLLISLSIWSREYIGLYSIIPAVLLVFWVWYNPRAFKPPVSIRSWASKSVLGEQIFINKETLDIPSHHIRIVNLLTAMILPGIPVLIYGLYINDLWIIFFGNFWILLTKMWFLDRMVWIYEDMKNSDFAKSLTG